jgi:two-component system OmpR family sensor kinase
MRGLGGFAVFSRISTAFDRLPIRTRLAGVSALLTFVILCAFALIVGSLTVHRIRSDFNREVAADAANLAGLLQIGVSGNYTQGFVITVHPNLDEYAAPGHAAIKVLTPIGEHVIAHTAHAPNLGPASHPYSDGAHGEAILKGHENIDGYRVESVLKALPPPIGGEVVIQYARPLSDVQATIARVELLLVLGTLAGSGLALLAGAMIARRAMQPITTLTSAAAEIARTRDSSATVPQSEADDEVAELARTLQGMLHSLDDAHAETEAMLVRQRRFVADASHELRTPLTSVLANLELLAESLRGEEAEAARSALRSSRRMRRLVADLLLLARTDVKREVAHEPCDLARIVLDAAAELGPLGSEHELTVDAHPAVVQGDHDELFRLALNLIENALRHTPPGTAIRASTAVEGAAALLVVEDDGPGVSPELAPTLFERFVRGAGDRGGSFGLGLAIVRAVAEGHGGSVVLEPAHPGRTPHGARFVVRLPLGLHLDHDGKDHRPALQPVVDELR